jgi:protein-S-isoprenylcysteine O-methyltransferase Ste14
MVLKQKARKEAILQTFLATFSYPVPIVLGYIVDRYFNMLRLVLPYNYLIGPVLMFFGPFIIFLATYDLMRFGKGTPNPSFPPKIFVSNGLYHYVRHPIYVGWIILLFGAVIYFSSLSMLEATLIIMFFIHFYTDDEERKLKATFGRSYAAYARRVPRWIPKIW